MSKILLAILVIIKIFTQIVSESVSEIDAPKMSIQSRRKVMQENFEEIKLIKQKEELVKIEKENEVKEEDNLQQYEIQEENEVKEEDNLQQCEIQEEINKQWVTFELSAYCPCEYCCDTYTGITASGLNVEVGMCAAPDNIPFDSICVIPELGMELNIQDRGGYIVNTYDGLVRLDVYCSSHEEALEFGRRIVEGYIICP